MGNWLTASEGEKLLSGFDPMSIRGKRDAEIISLLLGCGLRRSEVVGLKVHAIQRREDLWAIVDLVGKGGRLRTVPIPDWVKTAVDRLGRERARRQRQALQIDTQERHSLGKRHHTKRCLVLGEGVRWSGGNKGARSS